MATYYPHDPGPSKYGNADGFIYPIRNDAERLGYLNNAADLLFDSDSESRPEVSDLIFLADYIERGPDSYWLQRDKEATL